MRAREGEKKAHTERELESDEKGREGGEKEGGSLESD